MRALQRFCINRPVTTGMFYLGVILMGLISFKDLKVNLIPDIEYPRVTIVTLYSNSAPEEIENLITKPISEAVGTVGSIQKIQSESLEGISLVTLQFSWGTNIDFAVMEVREKLDLIRGTLPQDAGRSVVTRFDPNQSAFMEVVFFSKELGNSQDLRHYLRNEVKVFLERADGVAMVQFSGGHRKEVQVDVDAQALSAHRLTLPELREAIASANLNFPAGHITVGSRDVLIRSLGEYNSVEDIKRTIVGRNQQGTPIALSSVAEVHPGYAERTGMARYNGRECVIVSLYKEAGKNTIDVSKNVRKEMDLIRKQFGREVEGDIVYDESNFISNAVQNLIQAILAGAVLAFIALFIILRNIRNPMILLTILPTSVIATFIPMYFYNVSLNMMSLGGLELGIGMLLESGNVVMMSIERYAATGMPAREAALKGANEVAGSVTSAVLTLVVVFLPIVFLKSVVGVVFAEMALTITVATLVSLIVALTLIPTLSSLDLPWLSRVNLDRYAFVRKIGEWERRLDSAYERRLQYFLNNPRSLFVPVGALFVIACCLFPFIQRSFIPRVDTGEFVINLRANKGTSLAAMSEVVDVVEKQIIGNKEIQHVLSRVGYDEEEVLTTRSSDVGTHLAQIRVIMQNSRSVTARQLAAELERKIKVRDDVDVYLVAKSDVMSGILSPGSRAISLDLAGDDLGTLQDLGRKIKEDLSKVPGVTGMVTSMEDQAREFHVTFDEGHTSGTNLSHSYLADYLKTAIRGSVVTELHLADEEIDIRLRFREEDRKTIDRVLEIPLRTGETGSVYLSQLADLKPGKGYTSILRSGPSRINRITAEISGKDSTTVYNEIDNYLEKTRLPEGYHITHGGEQENISKSFRELLLAFGLSIVLIYMLLASHFESLVQPFIMLGTIPMIVIGVFPALLITGKSLNDSSFTGIILLVGIVVDNAALLYEYMELLKEEGFELRENIVNASRLVLRPIIMNNGLTILGMIPVALEIGKGSEFQSPLAITVISGLFASAVVSLFVIPVLFHIRMKRQAGHNA
ncbi:MAG: efflux RND transporter permease subunit [Leptospirales bacterium]|nr:efflux RND transporter permease subunit [Leptospirales bacterium]